MTQRGFTLIEVMIAMAVFGLVLASMAPAFATHMRANTNSEIKTGAIAAAQQTLDELRFEEVTSLPASGSQPAMLTPIGDRIYSVVVTYCAEADFCMTNRVRHIRVNVSYLNQEVYELETVYTELE